MDCLLARLDVSSNDDTDNLCAFEICLIDNISLFSLLRGKWLLTYIGCLDDDRDAVGVFKGCTFIVALLLLLLAADEWVLATSLIDIQSFLVLLIPLLLLLWIEDAVWLVVVCADDICEWDSSLSMLSNVCWLFWDNTLLGLRNPFGSGLISLLFNVPPDDTVLNVFDLLTPDEDRLWGEIGRIKSDDFEDEVALGGKGAFLGNWYKISDEESFCELDLLRLLIDFLLAGLEIALVETDVLGVGLLIYKT